MKKADLSSTCGLVKEAICLPQPNQCGIPLEATLGK